MTHNPPLLSTEKRLTRLFVIGIFLFLIIFEVVFLASRYFLEQRSQYNQFKDVTNAIMREAMHHGNNNPPPKTHNVGFIVLDSSGSVLRSRIAGQEVKQVSDIIPNRILNSLDMGTTVEYEGLLLRKMAQTDSGEMLLFLSPTNYDMSGLIRDMLRFFLLDLLILMPFWWMARVYVRETLEPVRDNMDTMTHFVHDAGHELKTPLAIISGNLQLMRDLHKHDPELVNESLKTIHSMNDSIEGLLELADLKLPDKREKTSLHAIVKSILSALDELIQSKNIAISIDIPEKSLIPMSHNHLSILMKNLIENAVKYNMQDGKIHISYKNKTIIVQDSGIGLNEEEKTRIFDRFYRAHTSNEIGGSGIGLTIVDRIVRLYGGSISVESETGKGTTLSVKI